MANNLIKGTIPESEKKRISANRTKRASAGEGRNLVKGTIPQADAKRIKSNRIYERVKKLYDDYNSDVDERQKYIAGEKSDYEKYESLQAPGLRFSSDRFRSEASDIKSYIEKNRSALSDEEYNDILKGVQKFIDSDTSAGDQAFSDYFEAAKTSGGREVYNKKIADAEKKNRLYKKFGITGKTTTDDIKRILDDNNFGLLPNPSSRQNSSEKAPTAAGVSAPLGISAEERKMLVNLLDPKELEKIEPKQQWKYEVQQTALKKAGLGENAGYMDIYNYLNNPNSEFAAGPLYLDQGQAAENHRLNGEEKKALEDLLKTRDMIDTLKGDESVEIAAEMDRRKESAKGNLQNAQRELQDFENFYTIALSYQGDPEGENNYIQNSGNGQMYAENKKYFNEKYGLSDSSTYADYEHVKSQLESNLSKAEADSKIPYSIAYYDDNNFAINWGEVVYEHNVGVMYKSITDENSENYNPEAAELYKKIADADIVEEWDYHQGSHKQQDTSRVDALKAQLKELTGYEYEDFIEYEKRQRDKERAAKVKMTVQSAVEGVNSVPGVGKFLGGVASAISAVPFALVSGTDYIINLADSVGHGGYGSKSYRPINTYDDYATNISSEITGTQTDIYDRAMKETGVSENARKFWTSAYSGFSSGINSLATVVGSCYAFGPVAGQIVASVILSGSAASSGLQEAVQNGSTTYEALAYGFASGVAEYLGEKISIGYLVDKYLESSFDVKSFKSFMKSFVKDKNLMKMLGQGAVEGSEEVVTEIMNRFSDAAINQDHSKLANAIRSYEEEGFSDEEAKKKAFLDVLASAAEQAWGGFIGGVMGGAASVIGGGAAATVNSVVERKTNEYGGRSYMDKQYGEGDTKTTGKQNVLKMAEEVLAEDSPLRDNEKVARLAKEIQQLDKDGKLDSKNKAVARKVGEFMRTGIEAEEQLNAENEKSNPRNVRKMFEESMQAEKDGREYKKAAGERQSENAAVYDGKIVYLSKTQGAESESRSLAMGRALTDAAAAIDAFNSISPKSVEDIGDAYMGDIAGIEKYGDAAMHAWAMGFNGMSLDDTVQSIKKLNSGARETAWEAGVRDAAAVYNEQNAVLQGTRAISESRGIFTERAGTVDTQEIQHLIDSDVLSAEQKSFIEATKQLADTFGIDFEFFESEVDENGNRHGDPGYIDGSGKIHIDIFAGQEGAAFIAEKSTLLATSLHELSHYIHDWSPRAWNDMYNYVVDRYSRYDSVQAAIERIKERALLDGETISDETAKDEFLAECCEALFEDEAGIKDFAAKHKNSAQKIVDWLNGILEKFAGIDLGRSESRAAAVVAQWEDGIEEFRDRFAAALDDAAKNKNAADSVLDENSQAEVRKARGERDNFVEDKYFKSHVNRWEDLKHGAYVNVGVIGGQSPLHLVGMPDGTIRFDVDKIKRNMTEHGDYLTVKLLNEIPGIIAHPVAISEFSAENTISVFGDVFVGNSPMMVGVTISKNRASNDISKVRTFNARKDVGNLINDESILYLDVNKRRTRQWFQACGIQVPLGGTKFGFIRSISRTYSNVNTESKNKFSTDTDTTRKSRSQRDVPTEQAERARPEAEEIARKWGLSEKKTEAVRRGLANIYEAMGGDTIDLKLLRQQAKSLAEQAARGMTVSDAPADVVQHISFLRSLGTVSFTEEQQAEAAKLAGTLKKYASSISSALKIKDGGITLDEAWQSLSREMPELFPADTAESDRAQILQQNALRFLADENMYKSEPANLADIKAGIEKDIYDKGAQYAMARRAEDGEKVKFENKVPRPTVRNMLADAALRSAKTEEERAALTEYKLNLETVNDMQTERNREFSKLLSMLPKSGYSAFTAEEIEAQRKVVNDLEKKIGRADRVLKESSLAYPLQQIYDRELKAQRESMQTATKEYISEMRERYAQREMMDKMRRIMARARKSVINPNSKNYIIAPFVEPMEELIRAIDPGPAMLNRAGEVTKTWEEYDRSRRTALARIAEMKKLMPKSTTGSEISSEMEIAVNEAKEALGEIEKLINKRAMGEMTSAELQQVYEQVRDVMNIMRAADRQVGVFEGLTNAEAGQKLIDETRSYVNSGKAKRLGIFANYLNPMRLADEFGQYDKKSYWAKYLESLNEGRKKGVDWYMKAAAPFEELKKERKNYISFSRDIVDSGLKDVNGNSVRMTHAKLVSVLMLIDREMASDSITHIEDPNGGLIIPDAELEKKGKYKEALASNRAQKIAFEYIAGKELADASDADKALAFTQSQKAWLAGMKNTLSEKLTDYDRKWISAAREFFSKKSKDAINQTMLKIGKKVIATEAMYFPMAVSDDYVAVQLNGIKYDASLLSGGILKEIQYKAPQPLVVSGVENVINNHMDYVSKVYGLSVPIRDIKAAYNTTFGRTSVKAELNRTDTAKYKIIVEHLMEDLQAQRRSALDKGLIKMLKTNFITSVLSGNISVTMKQAASYFTAGDVVSGKALAEALATKWGYYLGHCQEIYNEIDEHTPLHWERRRGMSIPELESINNTLSRQLDKIDMKQGIRNKIDPTKWIQAADVGTTALIWEACKIDVKGQNVEVGTQEYWNKVTALYEKAIENTQPMYDPLHRTEATKDPSPIRQMLYMFKTQPLQNFGVMYSSVSSLNTAIAEYKQAKKTGDTATINTAKEKLVAARAQLGRSVASQVSSLLVFNAMTLVAAAVRGKLDPWRDDNDELTAQSIAKRFGVDMLSNAAANFIPFIWFQTFATPVIKSVYNYFDNGKKFSIDKIELAPLQTANDLIGDIADLWNSIVAIEDDGYEPVMKSAGYLALSVGDILGHPATNLKNLFTGIYNNVKGFLTDGWDWQNQKDEYSTAAGVKKALNAGNTDKAAERAGEYIDRKTQDALDKEGAETNETKARQAAEKSLRSSVAGSYNKGYKGEYIEALFEEDEGAAADIEDTLIALNIGFNDSIFDDWRQQAEEAMLEYDSYDEYVRADGKLQNTTSGVKSAIDAGKTEEAALRFEKACEKKARELQKNDNKLSEHKAEQQAEEAVRNSVGTSYKSEWIKLTWQGYYEEADDIQSALRDVSDAFDNSYFRTWAKKLKELMREYSSYEEYEKSK